MKARIDFPRAEGGRERLDFSAPRAVLSATTPDEVPGVLAAAERQAHAGRWVVGCVAYEAAPAFDVALRVRPAAGPLPLAVFAIHDAPDQRADDAHAADFSCGPWRMLPSPEGGLAAVGAVQRGIVAGDYYQVNLTARLRAAFAGDGPALFDALRTTQPAGYCAHLDGGAWEVLSVSPELFFDWRPDSGVLTTRPMKGTAPRGADAATDAAAAQALRASAKERAENLMIVDLLRNDLARVAALGTVRVPELFALDALPTAWQMSSTVQCATRPGTSLAEIFRALFPCGSITGAPKVAAMAAIAALEEAPRGAYCGAIGLLRPGGHATFNVGIRSVVIDRTAGRAECGIGSGIVADSTAAAELDEWRVKRGFLLRATAHFELLETLRLEDGAYPERARHLARMAASAAHFGFAFDRACAAAALDELARRHPAGAWRARLLCDRAGVPRAACHALEAAPAAAAVVLAAGPIEGDAEFFLHKTTERAAYAAFVPPAGVFDTLLWNARGELTEFTRGNVVVELDGRRVTPPVACGLLPGVGRAILLERGAVTERVVRREDLPRATGLWFVNSLRGCLPVRLDAGVTAA